MSSTLARKVKTAARRVKSALTRSPKPAAKPAKKSAVRKSAAQIAKANAAKAKAAKDAAKLAHGDGANIVSPTPEVSKARLLKNVAARAGEGRRPGAPNDGPGAAGVLEDHRANVVTRGETVGEVASEAKTGAKGKAKRGAKSEAEVAASDKTRTVAPPPAHPEFFTPAEQISVLKLLRPLSTIEFGAEQVRIVTQDRRVFAAPTLDGVLRALALDAGGETAALLDDNEGAIVPAVTPAVTP